MHTPSLPPQAHKEGTSTGYLLLCFEQCKRPLFAIDAISSHPLYVDVMESAKIFLGPNVQLFDQEQSKLIFQVPDQTKSDFFDHCQRFRNSLLGLELHGYLLSQVLFVLTMCQEGDSPEQVVHRLMNGVEISQKMLASHGLCMV